MTPCYDGTQQWRQSAGFEWYVAQSLDEIETTWHAARDFCLLSGGDIASINNQAEHDFITNWVCPRCGEGGQGWRGEGKGVTK